MAWKLNPSTGKLDYHKVGTYQLFADANVTTWLTTHGFMEAAPIPPAAAPAGGMVFQDDAGLVFQDEEDLVFQDD